MVGNNFKGYKKADKPRVEHPTSIQDCIEIYAISDDGLFMVGKGSNGNNLYSKTYMFSDINYSTESEEVQKEIIVRYCKFLNSINTRYKLTINNRYKDMQLLREEVLMQPLDDGLNDDRDEFNKIIEDKIMQGRQGTEQEKYLTISVMRRTEDDARNYFKNIESTVKRGFADLGSFVVALDAEQRLRLIYELYNVGRESEFHFDFDDFLQRKSDFRNALGHGSLRFEPKYIKINDKYCCSIYIAQLPSQLDDTFLCNLMDLEGRTICSIDYNPVPKDEALAILKSKYLNIEDSIRKQQQKRNKNRDFSSDISYSKRMEKEDMEGYLEEVRNYDQDVVMIGVDMLVFADDLKDLEVKVDAIKDFAKGEDVYFEINEMCQREGFNTVLPIGVRQDKHMVTQFTRCLGAFLPFNVMELYTIGGFFYGTNQESKNIVVGNRKKLMNGNGWIIGKSGSGKSVFVKMEQTEVKLHHYTVNGQVKKDDIIVIDPMGEYKAMCDNYNGQYIEFGTNTNNHINPFEINESIAKVDIIKSKTEFSLAICEQAKRDALTATELTYIGRALQKTYANLIVGATDEPPTLTDFTKFLMEEDGGGENTISLALEAYCEGGQMDMFGHKSNVNLNNSFVCYGMTGLGKHLRLLAMTIMLEHINMRVYDNWKKGITTWIYVDEAHEMVM